MGVELPGRKKTNISQAIKDYTKALELQPDLVKAYNNRAIAYILQSKLRASVYRFLQGDRDDAG